MRKGQVLNIPPSTCSWLFETGSLTQRLRACCNSGIQVKVLFQHWAKPFVKEALTLGLTGHHYALIREVRLESEGQPLIIARTLIPSDALLGAHRRLRDLGARPLGDVLFSDPGLHRQQSDLLLCASSVWQPYILNEIQADKLWGRRTLYSLGERRMLVAEFFLPEVFDMRVKSSC
ncbi:MAG: chorismate lyase [Methylococcales bacterium]|nr:chorismate lyase [Methylococcales bacterium]